jgi:hypothetical protein
MTTMINGAQTTATVNTSTHVRDVSRLHYLDPDISPFTHLIREARSEVADNFKFEWGEKTLAPKWDQVNGAQTSGDTSIEVDNGGYFKPHDLVKNPRTGEQIRVTAVTGNTLTVVRATGSTAAAAMNDNDDLLIIGQAVSEGAALPVARDHQETMPYNYTQIFRRVVSATGTEQATKHYFGDPRTRKRAEVFKDHRIDMESAFLFGERNRDVADTGAPRGYTGGLEYWISTNVKDASGALSLAEIWDWTEDLFAHTGGSSSRMVIHSPLIGTVIDLLAEPRIQIVPKDKMYGLAIRELQTSHGTLLLMKHHLMVDGAGGEGYADDAFAFDPTQVKHRYLEGRKSTLKINRQNPGDDLWADEYLEESGLEVANESLHGQLYGVTS